MRPHSESLTMLESIKETKITAELTAYADGLVLFFPDNDHLQNGINILQNTFTNFGLTINASKTKSNYQCIKD